jgi:hypothetical protein
MSRIGARLRNGRGMPLARNPRAEQIGPAAAPSLDNTPYRLLWSTGIVAVVLGIAAFVLWGLHGAGTLFDMMVALCS